MRACTITRRRSGYETSTVSGWTKIFGLLGKALS